MELKQKVETLISDTEKTHKYSMSLIYGLYNEVFSVAESPQSCASCLIRKVNELKQWLAKQEIEGESKLQQDNVDTEPNKPQKKRGRKPKDD